MPLARLLRMVVVVAACALVATSCASDSVVVSGPRLAVGATEGSASQPLAGGVEDALSIDDDGALELPEGFTFGVESDADSEGDGVGGAEPGPNTAAGSAATVLHAAALVTEEAPAYRFELWFSMELSDGFTDMKIDPDEPLAVGAVSGLDTWTRIDLGVVFDAVLDSAEGDPETEALVSALGDTDLAMEVVTIGTDTMYLRAPLLELLSDFGALPNAEDWVGIGDGWAIVDLTEIQGLDADEVAALAGAGAGASADSMLGLLDDVGATVVEVGRVDIRGVATTRYDATVEVLSMLETQGADPAMIAELVGSGALDAELPFQVYVDDQGRLRRLELNLDLDSIAGLAGETPPPGADFNLSTTIDFFDFDAAVEVLAPPPGEVIAEWTDALVVLQDLAA